MRLSVSPAGESRFTVAGVGDARVREGFYSERPDTVVNGITIRAAGFTGVVAGMDLVSRRLRTEARFEIGLQRAGEALAGTATIVTREETVPMAIGLRRVK
jgi:hypothetical protein